MCKEASLLLPNLKEIKLQYFNKFGRVASKFQFDLTIYQVPNIDDAYRAEFLVSFMKVENLGVSILLEGF